MGAVTGDAGERSVGLRDSATLTHVPRVNAGRVPLFCDTALARRIELAEAQLIARASEAARRRAGTAGFVFPIAGGMASFAEDGSPFNKVAGLGFAAVPGRFQFRPDRAGLRRQRRAGAGRAVLSCRPRDRCPALPGRGYRLESFENVLGYALTGESPRGMPPGLEVGPSGEEEFTTRVGVVAEGVAHPDTQGVPWHVRVCARGRDRGRARHGRGRRRGGTVRCAGGPTWKDTDDE